MEFSADLESSSAPKIRKAAEKIFKNKTPGYCDELINALKQFMGNPKAWQTQSILIRALGATNCQNSAGFLKTLVDLDHSNHVIYRDLGFSIALLEYTENKKFDFLFSILSSENYLLIAGACSALLFASAIPSEPQMQELMKATVGITENEGRVITPRCYIAALAYLWPKNLTETFLENCKSSTFSGLKDIASTSLQGKPSKIQLI